MKLLPYSLLALVLGLTACDSQPHARAHSSARTHQAPDAPTDQTAGQSPDEYDREGATDDNHTDQPDQPNQSSDNQAVSPQASPPAMGGYQLLGIIDPGINNEVAFALKVPRGWKTKQSFTRKWNGSTPLNQVYITAHSPDGADQIEYFPSNSFFYSDGPMARSLRQTAQQYGAQQPRTPGELPPMPALTYIKQVLLPQLAQRGLQLRPTGEHEVPQQQLPNNTVKSSGYVEGTLSNGKKARINCIVNLMTTQLNGESYYNWEALTGIAQSTHDVAKCHEYLKTGYSSVVMNPAWAQQNQQLVTKGNAINNDINRQNYEIQRDLQQHQQKTYAAIREDRNASQDRQNEAFGDMIRGEAKYVDPTTGERVKVQDGYNHVYRDRQDPTTTYSTNAPVDAGQVNWQELQRVALKDY